MKRINFRGEFNVHDKMFNLMKLESAMRELERIRAEVLKNVMPDKWIEEVDSQLRWDITPEVLRDELRANVSATLFLRAEAKVRKGGAL